MEVVSNEGMGSRFELYFPAAPATHEQATRANPASIRGRGERVLCVDDEASILRATTLVLERLAYEVVPHSEPARALAELSTATHFDAVVTDCSMPTIWGLEFVREVLARRPGIPIVMMSGLLEPGLEGALRELGVREFVSKPATVEELGAALSRSFNAHASGPA